MSITTLKIEGLSYHQNKKPLINSVSFSLEKGTLHALLGLNGSGKSTLLKTLARIWKPTLGSIFVDGENTAVWDRKKLSRTLSLIPQGPNLTFQYRVDEMVAMGYYATSCRSTISIDQALKTVDALHLKTRLVTSLSAGERQRIYIARSLITEAPILLFDEPTSALDPRHQLEIWRLLRSLANTGSLIIIATHDLSAAITYCDSASLLHQGAMITSGLPKQVLSPKNLHTIFGLSLEDQPLVKQSINNL